MPSRGSRIMPGQADAPVRPHPDTSSEEWRRICEARHYLRQGYTTAEQVHELRQRIAAKRGAAAADELIEEMRRQWRTRAEWMSPEP